MTFFGKGSVFRTGKGNLLFCFVFSEKTDNRINCSLSPVDCEKKLSKKLIIRDSTTMTKALTYERLK